jgi:hypothetical protein
MEKNMSFYKEKFKNLVHYICEKADNPAVLGAIKLNKVLYYSDVIHYMIHGVPMTGETYIKRQYGFVPRHVMPIIEELIAEQKVMRGKQDYFGRMKTEFIAIEACNLSSFTPEEIALVDDAYEHVCLNHTATSVSEETHTVIWKLARMGEEIPYFTVFATDVSEVDEEDISWAEQFLQKAA